MLNKFCFYSDKIWKKVLKKTLRNIPFHGTENLLTNTECGTDVCRNGKR